MHAVVDRAQLGFVTNDRGAEIQRRLDRLNLSDRDFERRTGVERKTLRRAIDEGSRTRESTFRSIEAALDQLEKRFEGEPTTAPPAATGPSMVTFRLGKLAGDVDVVVEGPIEDIDKLRETVERLLAASESKRDDAENGPK